MLIFHSENHLLASSLTSTAAAATDRVSSGGDSEASPGMSLRDSTIESRAGSVPTLQSPRGRLAGCSSWGTLPQELLRTGFVEEANLTKDHVRNAQALAVVNSVRGLLMLRPRAHDSWLLEPIPEGSDCDSLFRPCISRSGNEAACGLSF
jgi:hypothetical protein